VRAMDTSLGSNSVNQQSGATCVSASYCTTFSQDTRVEFASGARTGVTVVVAWSTVAQAAADPSSVEASAVEQM
jgi:hypothetical protein